jgi:mitogen-activated protein kinase 15
LLFAHLFLTFRGAYGVVWKAVARKNNQVVAVKKCFDAFQNSTDAQRTFREIMYLQALSGHENIVQILNVLKAENDQDIYIVTDFLESDLHAVVRAGILQDVHKQYIIYQVLRALKFMHSGDLIHRDIKPSNILLNSDCSMKMCDFGLARSVRASEYRQQAAIMTDYVATRWYRAPEILLGSPHYTKGVDIWAVGCILAEMIIGKPVFPGTSTLDQIERILLLTGRPSASEIATIQSPFAATMLESIKLPDKTISVKRNLEECLPNANHDMIDFLSLCFQFSPAKRPSAEVLLNHKLMSAFHDPSAEPVCSKPIQIQLDDNIKLTAKDYRTLLYDGVISRKKEINRDRRTGVSNNTSAIEKRLLEPPPTSYDYPTRTPVVPTPEPSGSYSYPIAASAHQRMSYRQRERISKTNPTSTSSATESFFGYLFSRWQ